jgi:hypothetical protein
MWQDATRSAKQDAARRRRPAAGAEKKFRKALDRSINLCLYPHCLLMRGASRGDPEVEQVRRPRAGFAGRRSGGPGQPSAGTKTGCLEWLDVAGTKGGGSRPDQGREERSVPRREARRQGLKIAAWSAARRAPVAKGRPRRQARTNGRLAALHPLALCGGRRKAPLRRGRGLRRPRAAKNRGDDACPEAFARIFDISLTRRKPLRALAGQH